jgi:hypothetical protein
MKRKDVNVLLISILLLLVVVLFGCAKPETETIVNVEDCSVSQNGTDAIITCPDGTEVTLPAQFIDREVVIISPVMIQVPKNKCKKD